MDFKLFFPLASTLVVGGTFTVFYMGYLKNKEIRERKLNVIIPKIALQDQSDSSVGKDEKPEEESGSKEPKSVKVPQSQSAGSKDQVPKSPSKSSSSTTTTKAQSKGSSPEPDKSSAS